jgi:type II secretory pathway pseudopilin PulG
MRIFKTQKNRGFTPTPSLALLLSFFMGIKIFYINKIKTFFTFSFIKSNKKTMPNLVSGFTLVETMFAVYILTFTIVGLMTVISNSLFAARYAKDEVTANYLLQEVVDYIRNDRDTTVFLGSGSGTTGTAWNTFTTHYSACSSSGSSYGCYFEVLNGSVPNPCEYSSDTKSTGCPPLYYNDAADNSPFYTYDQRGGLNKPTIFKRKIVVNKNGDDELDVTVTAYWKNGGLPVSRSLTTTLMNWQK